MHPSEADSLALRRGNLYRYPEETITIMRVRECRHRIRANTTLNCESREGVRLVLEGLICLSSLVWITESSESQFIHTGVILVAA